MAEMAMEKSIEDGNYRAVMDRASAHPVPNQPFACCQLPASSCPNRLHNKQSIFRARRSPAARLTEPLGGFSLPARRKKAMTGAQAGIQQHAATASPSYKSIASSLSVSLLSLLSVYLYLMPSSSSSSPSSFDISFFSSDLEQPKEKQATSSFFFFFFLLTNRRRSLDLDRAADIPEQASVPVEHSQI
ncbi:uncharacterized protein ARB_07141 [Trichophyton benhamiae CBS 112371]|uniref:Uncharacterized protein n=1 Tax=Arthroderma benhamiae (strain ATCC MYA-4681 / CBS 112371) TaxID=663331 RepID=D4ASC6_ARTBC|nr:uncharacterized protein ARB_07141 [Trichophyton benhamiae CBS 112371]EFE34190.1 hypothetical protein ARB_07141 [Trichophyton benhamiae CBS 112371]